MMLFPVNAADFLLTFRLQIGALSLEMSCCHSYYRSPGYKLQAALPQAGLSRIRSVILILHNPEDVHELTPSWHATVHNTSGDIGRRTGSKTPRCLARCRDS